MTLFTPYPLAILTVSLLRKRTLVHVPGVWLILTQISILEIAKPKQSQIHLVYLFIIRRVKMLVHNVIYLLLIVHLKTK